MIFAVGQRGEKMRDMKHRAERLGKMINDNIHPIDPTGFRTPTETEDAISETLKLCGISGEDASMMFIEVMKKLGKNDNFSECCRSHAERRTDEPDKQAD